MPCLNRRTYFLYPLCPLKCSKAHHNPAGAAFLQKIHEKVMSLGYQDAVTEIYSVDSQYSLQDGVIVQVTGSLRCTVSRFQPGFDLTSSFRTFLQMCATPTDQVLADC